MGIIAVMFKIFNSCFLGCLFFYCPGKEAALGSIVVSLTYTAYLWGAFITFCYRLPPSPAGGVLLLAH